MLICVQQLVLVDYNPQSLQDIGFLLKLPNAFVSANFPDRSTNYIVLFIAIYILLDNLLLNCMTFFFLNSFIISSHKI